MNRVFLPKFLVSATLLGGILAASASATFASKPCAAAKGASFTQAQQSSPAAPALASSDRTKLKDWKIAEEFDFDWQGNGAPAHFKIEQSEEEQLARLTIKMKGQPDFVLDTDDVWEQFKNDFTPDEKFLVHYHNLSSSKYAYVLPPSNSGKLRPLVFLVTPEYGSDPGTLYVFALDASGRPKIIFKNIFHIVEFRDLDGDGLAEIAGQPCFSQGWGHDFLTYDPFHVYHLPAGAEGEFKLSLPLTEKYNRERYYGWEGPDCSEQLAVVLHPPGGGKPVIVPAKQAEKMFPKKK
jgi:hypothetical protein